MGHPVPTHISRVLWITVGRSASVATALMERSDLQYQERRSGDVRWDGGLMLSCSTLAWPWLARVAA